MIDQDSRLKVADFAENYEQMVTNLAVLKSIPKYEQEKENEMAQKAEQDLLALDRSNAGMSGMSNEDLYHMSHQSSKMDSAGPTTSLLKSKTSKKGSSDKNSASKLSRKKTMVKKQTPQTVNNKLVSMKTLKVGKKNEVPQFKSTIPE